MSLYAKIRDARSHLEIVHKVASFAPYTEGQCADLSVSFWVETVCGKRDRNVSEIFCETGGQVCHECFPWRFSP